MSHGIERERDMWKQIVRDLVDDQDCLPTCDSIAHDEKCPVMSAANAVKFQTERARKLEIALRELMKAQATYDRVSLTSTRDVIAEAAEELSGAHFAARVALEEASSAGSVNGFTFEKVTEGEAE